MQNTWISLHISLCSKEPFTFFYIFLIKFCVHRQITIDILVILKPTVAAADVQQNRFGSTELKQNTCQLKGSSVSASSPPVIPSYEETTLQCLTSFPVQSVKNPDTVPKRLLKYQRAANVASQCSPASSGTQATVPEDVVGIIDEQ